jgi:hypothetical protein
MEHICALILTKRFDGCIPKVDPEMDILAHRMRPQFETRGVEPDELQVTLVEQKWVLANTAHEVEMKHMIFRMRDGDIEPDVAA